MLKRVGKLTHCLDVFEFCVRGCDWNGILLGLESGSQCSLCLGLQHLQNRNLETYQYTVNNNNYQDGRGLPAAVFSYDISPMQVCCMQELQAF